MKGKEKMRGLSIATFIIGIVTTCLGTAIIVLSAVGLAKERF